MNQQYADNRAGGRAKLRSTRRSTPRARTIRMATFGGLYGKGLVRYFSSTREHSK